MVRLTVILIAIISLSCNSPKSRPSDKVIDDDTIIVSLIDTNSVTKQPKPPVGSSVLLKERQDSVRRILFYETLAVNILRKHKKSTFSIDTVYEEEESHLTFKPIAFQKGKIHTIVQIQDDNSNLPILLLQKSGNKWKLKYVFEGESFTSDSVIVDDYNFDGINDFAIQWYYSAGRCNCSTGCYSVYIYNASKQTFNYVPEFRKYLDVEFSKREKAVYLGGHCGGDWTKYRWKKHELIPVESYGFENTEGDDYYYALDANSIRKHNIYKNGKQLLHQKTKNNQLPPSWERIFFRSN